MFKISNKTFYYRHKLEIEKYLENKNSLHILNIDSKNKIINVESDKLLLDLNDPNNVPTLDKNKKYDRILLTDVIENHEDVFTLLSTISDSLTDDGKLIISSINSKYSLIFKFFEYLKIKDSNKNNAYIHLKKIKNITNGLGLEYQKFYTKQFFPFKLFFLGGIINRMLEVLFFPFNLGIKTYMIFRPLNRKGKKLTKSIIIPAKNEEGNLKELVSRIPKFDNTEIIFSYGQSEDKTLDVMNEISDMYNNYLFKIVMQSETGKANAVWEALEVVENEVIAILDADISVEPETLVDFFQIIEKNSADFVNGTRLVYEMDKKSMRFLNKLGNRFFQFFISKIINEPLTDSLCGTKVFKKSNIDDLYRWQKIIDVKDPFGDFDMIFSAAYSGQKIVELPISYKERRYGTTQISRFRDGYKLLVYLIASFRIFNTSR
tara:strand:- start:12534 stop:13832 length:1299 start_codon:yes stop_codon:yes gene_type:complete